MERKLTWDFCDDKFVSCSKGVIFCKWLLMSCNQELINPTYIKVHTVQSQLRDVEFSDNLRFSGYFRKDNLSIFYIVTLCDLVAVFKRPKVSLNQDCTVHTYFHATKTAINWRYFSSHAFNTMSTHLSGLHPWTIKSGLFVNMISNSLLPCAMKRIFWPRLWSFRGEEEKGLLTFFFISVSSNIIHKLQIYYFINLWNIILQKLQVNNI